MQSLLQYRRFENHLRQQVERHGIDATAGGRRSTNAHPNSHSDSVTKPKDLEAGPAPLVQDRDHARKQNEIPDTDPEKSQPDFLGVGDDAFGDGNLSGSTTRRSSFSDPDSARPELSSLSTTTTRETIGTNLGHSLTGVNVRSRTTREGRHEKAGKVFVVGYVDENDPLNPHNWSGVKRMMITFLVSSIGLIVGFASSVDSAVIQQARKEFGVSEVTESVATGMYLVGFGFGAFFAAPISETVGRNPVYIATMTLFMIFIMASGLAPNIGAQVAFRFLAGLFGATPLVCAGASVSDMWSACERTVVFPVVAHAAFWGAILGPVVGGFIGQAASQGTISWRWTAWVTLIASGLILGTTALFLPETYAPTLLKWKASHLRKITGDDRYMSPLEVQDTKFFDRLLHNMYWPFVLFAYEPIAVLFSLYLSVVYIVLFSFLTGFEFIFTDVFGLNQGHTYLCFLGIGVGFLGAAAMVSGLYRRHKRMLAAVEKNGGTRLPPEQRLIFAMIAAPFLPIGLFWMAWTAYASLGIWPCLIATAPIGFAIMAVYISIYQYLIDTFEAHTASALVGATFVRYVAAGVMVEVSIPMYENLGVHWTLTVLGAIAALMTPVPFVFFKYGSRIRKHSRHATDFSLD